MATAFLEDEKRNLAIRAEEIDPKYLIDGEPPAVQAELIEIDASPQKRGPRRYALTSGTEADVRLFNGDPADDQGRLEIIVENLLKDETELIAHVAGEVKKAAKL